MDEALKSVDELYLVSPKQRRQVTTRRVHARVEDIRRRLRALAQELGTGSKLPSTRELCSSLQTSITTLTAALDLLETEQVLCRKERQGIFVADTIHQKVIHVVYNIYNDFSRSPFLSLLWARLVQEIEKRSNTRNEQYRFHFLYRPFGQILPEDHLSLFNSLQIDGCLLVGVSARNEVQESLLHVPHAVFGGTGETIVDFALTDNVRLIVEALVKQKCKRIAYFSYLSSQRERSLEDLPYTKIWKRTLAAYDIPIYPELFRALSFVPDGRLPLQEQGYALAKEMFSQPHEDWPDGIYIGDDMMTSGALVAWEELGVQVGKDIKVVSHANAGSPMLFGKTGCMTLFEIDPDDIVRALFANLDQAMLTGYTPEEIVTFIHGRIRIPV